MLDPSLPDVRTLPPKDVDPNIPLALNSDLTLTPVKAAELSFRLFVPLPASGEMLSTIRKGVRLFARYLVVCELDPPPPKRLNSDLTAPASGEINHALLVLLPPPFAGLFDVVVYVVASSCLESACGVAPIAPVLELLGNGR